ncbi:enoyl-CoA hydratase/isomerase family protein [Aquicoccus sp. SCR17]|nr:enoyl-CoA hydratase/isomerase family protein [Carideicomes alvinocaridis]
MGDVTIRKEGRAGRITLSREKALNALSWEMCLEMESALDAWADDEAVALVVIDAAGEKAFCAGGDIAEMYRRGQEGDFDYGRQFWRDEYRLNTKLAEYGKPIVSFMQGFVMGGGVGVGCHLPHRVVGDSTQMAMPECGIGLIPDVGGTLLLSGAPGRLGEYLGLTGARMGPGDAIAAGFADHYLPEADWPQAIESLCRTGTLNPLTGNLGNAPDPALDRDVIDRHFAGEDVGAILASLRGDDSEFAAKTLKVLERGCPISMAATLRMVQALGDGATIRDALAQEFRFTYRSMTEGDFLEGVRAAIIDKDRSPQWRHAPGEVPAETVDHILAPLGDEELKL